MIKLALIGKNISHSRSPEIYKKYIQDNLHYDLLDFESESEIPSAISLLDKYVGVSITSPYKTHFIKQVKLVGEANELNAINCLVKKDGLILGCNTDYLAIVDLLKGFNQQYGNLNVVILGDGVMSKVTQYALIKLGMNFQVFSRRISPDFKNLNLVDLINQERLLVINTCSREFIYQNELDSKIIFWDFNYSFEPHELKFSKNCIYVDGYSMLLKQAEYALSFWSIKTT